MLAAAAQEYTLNFEGLALVLGAIGVLLGSVGSFVVSMVTLFRQGKLAENVQKIETATNSMKDALVKATREQSLLEGADRERQEETARKATKAKGLIEGPIT